MLFPSTLLLLLSLCGALFSSEKPRFQYHGRAVDLKTGRYLYSDNHKEFFKNGKHLFSDIEYKDGEGKIFATKHIEFDQNPSLPTFETLDSRDGYTEGAEVNGKTVRLYYRRKKEDNLEEKTYTPKTPAVMDGGFDYFVRLNWDSLMKGDRLQFHFVTPVQLDDYSFAVEKIEDTQWKNRSAVSLRLEVDNIVLKRIVDPFYLVYDKSSKRLLQFEGLSNINDSKGKSLKVKITYDYPQSVLAP